MAKQPIKPSDNNANQQNPNKGKDGTNKQHDKAQGNRGKQLNPNAPKPTPPTTDGNGDGKGKA